MKAKMLIVIFALMFLMAGVSIVFAQEETAQKQNPAPMQRMQRQNRPGPQTQATAPNVQRTKKIVEFLKTLNDGQKKALLNSLNEQQRKWVENILKRLEKAPQDNKRAQFLKTLTPEQRKMYADIAGDLGGKTPQAVPRVKQKEQTKEKEKTMPMPDMMHGEDRRRQMGMQPQHMQPGMGGMGMMGPMMRQHQGLTGQPNQRMMGPMMQRNQTQKNAPGTPPAMGPGMMMGPMMQRHHGMTGQMQPGQGMMGHQPTMPMHRMMPNRGRTWQKQGDRDRKEMGKEPQKWFGFRKQKDTDKKDVTWKGKDDKVRKGMRQWQRGWQGNRMHGMRHPMMQRGRQKDTRQHRGMGLWQGGKQNQRRGMFMWQRDGQGNRMKGMMNPMMQHGRGMMGNMLPRQGGMRGRNPMMHRGFQGHQRGMGMMPGMRGRMMGQGMGMKGPKQHGPMMGNILPRYGTMPGIGGMCPMMQK